MKDENRRSQLLANLFPPSLFWANLSYDNSHPGVNRTSPEPSKSTGKNGSYYVTSLES
jgi:hypothetical protein